MRQGDFGLRDVVAPVGDVHPVEVHGTPGIIADLAGTAFSVVRKEKEQEEGQARGEKAARHGVVLGLRLNGNGPRLWRGGGEEARRLCEDLWAYVWGWKGWTCVRRSVVEVYV